MLETFMVMAAFLSGSLPMSYWLGKLALHGSDVRKFGDGNPGATNVMRAGGWRLGLLALILDVTKGALPVGLAYQVFGIHGLAMTCIALAPTLGHAFSPFLGWHGGKALAVTLGVWIGLALHQISIPILVFLSLWFAIFAIDGWTVLFTILTTAVYLLLFYPDPLFLSVLAGQAIIILWKHRKDITKRPVLRKWLINMWKKKQSLKP
jgi:glycerol-3-phosphate acyltransferase PlsY